MLVHPAIANIVLMLLGAAGLTLASYIYHCKHKKQPLVCPINGSCDLVTSSRYATFCGVPVENLGVLYYSIVTLFHLAALAVPGIFTATTALISLALSSAAFLFSLYLISIQAFVIRHWCTWCLASAFLSAAIFFMTFLAAPAGLAF